MAGIQEFKSFADEMRAAFKGFQSQLDELKGSAAAGSKRKAVAEEPKQQSYSWFPTVLEKTKYGPQTLSMQGRPYKWFVEKNSKMLLKYCKARRTWYLTHPEEVDPRHIDYSGEYLYIPGFYEEGKPSEDMPPFLIKLSELEKYEKLEMPDLEAPEHVAKKLKAAAAVPKPKEPEVREVRAVLDADATDDEMPEDFAPKPKAPSKPASVVSKVASVKAPSVKAPSVKAPSVAKPASVVSKAPSLAKAPSVKDEDDDEEDEEEDLAPEELKALASPLKYFYNMREELEMKFSEIKKLVADVVDEIADDFDQMSSKEAKKVALDTMEESDASDEAKEKLASYIVKNFIKIKTLHEDEQLE
jgi:hypothetical protein